MYRGEGWKEGHYIDNHKKYECMDCGKEFIIGERLMEDCPPNFPVCPYCGQSNVINVVQTENDELEMLASDMGCLAIYVDEEK